MGLIKACRDHSGAILAPILGHLGPSWPLFGLSWATLAANLLLNFVLGHLNAPTNSSQTLFGKLCCTLSLLKTIVFSMVFASFANRRLCSLLLASSPYMHTTSQPRGSPDTPETASEAPRWPQDRPKCLQEGPKPLAISRVLATSYVWESFWGDLEMSLNHFYPIIKSLGPSSAYLGPLLQPTCSSTSPLGTLMPKLTASKLCLAGCGRPSGCRKPLFFQWFLLVLLCDSFAAWNCNLTLQGHNIRATSLPRHPRNSPRGPKMTPRWPQNGPKTFGNL